MERAHEGWWHRRHGREDFHSHGCYQCRYSRRCSPSPWRITVNIVAFTVIKCRRSRRVLYTEKGGDLKLFKIFENVIHSVSKRQVKAESNNMISNSSGPTLTNQFVNFENSNEKTKNWNIVRETDLRILRTLINASATFQQLLFQVFKDCRRNTRKNSNF